MFKKIYADVPDEIMEIIDKICLGCCSGVSLSYNKDNKNTIYINGFYKGILIVSFTYCNHERTGKIVKTKFSDSKYDEIQYDVDKLNALLVSWINPLHDKITSAKEIYH